MSSGLDGKKERDIETRDANTEKRVGVSRLTVGRIRCLKQLERK